MIGSVHTTWKPSPNGKANTTGRKLKIFYSTGTSFTLDKAKGPLGCNLSPAQGPLLIYPWWHFPSQDHCPHQPIHQYHTRLDQVTTPSCTSSRNHQRLPGLEENSPPHCHLGHYKSLLQPDGRKEEQSMKDIANVYFKSTIEWQHSVPDSAFCSNPGKKSSPSYSRKIQVTKSSTCCASSTCYKPVSTCWSRLSLPDASCGMAKTKMHLAKHKPGHHHHRAVSHRFGPPERTQLWFVSKNTLQPSFDGKWPHCMLRPNNSLTGYDFSLRLPGPRGNLHLVMGKTLKKCDSK